MNKIIKKLDNIKYWHWAIIAVVIVIFDQAAKIIVENTIAITDCIHVIPGIFDFVFVKNTGAAFSILSESTMLLGFISIAFCAAVLAYWYIKKPTEGLVKLSATLLFAGALGNAIDRILRGFVIDFISTAFITFPVFNIADIAITFGAVILMINLLFLDGQEKKEDNNDGENCTDSP